MTAPRHVYGTADVAKALGVSRPAVTNWRARGLEIPPPDHVTVDGRAFWYDLAPWHEWHAARARAAARVAVDRAAEAADRANMAAARARDAADSADRAARYAADLDAKAQLAELAARNAASSKDTPT